MPRYFFDIHDRGPSWDDTGQEFDNLDAVRAQAIQTLPDVAREDIPKDGDQRTFTVLVSSEDGKPVYAGTLVYTGMWLMRNKAE